jgi:hypothetical protein
MASVPESAVFPWEHEWRENRIKTTTEEIAAMTVALENMEDLDDEARSVMKANLKISKDYLNSLIVSPFLWIEHQE